MGESKLKRSRAEEMPHRALACRRRAVAYRFAGMRTGGHADGAVGVLHRVSDADRVVAELAGSLPALPTSPNAPGKADVLGTWMLSILSGHRRYSHVTTIRCDGVNPGLLGMNKVISEDALRRALLAIPGRRRRGWLDGHLRESTAPCSMCRGFWTSTRRSSRCTANGKARWCRTTRRSRGGPRTATTPT